MQRFFPKLLSLAFAAASAVSAHGATVNYAAGDNFNLFETTTGDEMVGGTMFAGTFASAPEVGVSYDDVLRNFLTFDALDSPSNSFGQFNAASFTGAVDSTPLASGKIYLLIVNYNAEDVANQIALISSSDVSWTFPANDGIAPSASINLDTIDQYYRGAADTIDDPGGSGLDGIASTQLETIPEPSSILLILLGTYGILRRKR